MRTGALQGLRVLEFAGLGPAPFAAMMLADHGAEVVRIDRPAGRGVPGADDDALALQLRGRSRVALDLKRSDHREAALDLAACADVLIDAYRPGVLEKLGVGPADCEGLNPRLVYARATGWGQDGPLAQSAGHDINYLGLSGALAAIGPPEKPTIPLNVFGDFAGGSMYLLYGILAALYERQSSGRGQVVDASMLDGAASLMTSFASQYNAGSFQTRRGANLTDGGAPFYDVYRTLDGRWIAVGALEPAFFRNLLAALDIEPVWADRQYDRAVWSALRKRIAARIATRTRDEWGEHFAGRDTCASPVLDIAEAPRHPHNLARRNIVEQNGRVQPMPAPRLSRTPARLAGDPADVEISSLIQTWKKAASVCSHKTNVN